MIASGITVEQRGDRAALVATVSSERGGIDRVRLEWVLPQGRPEWLCTAGDVVVAALLLPAMRIGEELAIEAPVSRQLLNSIPTIVEILLAWIPGLSRPTIIAEARTRVSTTNATGLFFSCGVDSFYSLMKNLKRDEPDVATASHLILADGFDIRPGNPRLFERIAANAREVSDRTGLELVVIDVSTVRALSDRFVPWGFGFGPVLASIGLALGGLLNTCIIPSSHDYGELVPLGSHPLLDPLWSTETVKFVHDGCEASRTDKIRRLATFELALRHLRVCWPDWTDDYNCGRCEKCVRTMIALHIAGVLGRATTFPSELSPATVKQMELITGESSLLFLEDLLGALGDSPADRRLAGALHHVVRRVRLRAMLAPAIPKALRSLIQRALHRRRLVHHGGGAAATTDRRVQ